MESFESVQARPGPLSGPSQVGPAQINAAEGPLLLEDQDFMDLSQQLQSALKDGRHANRKLDEALQAQRQLIHEIDHRVKNNLQMISSLIVMQGRNSGDPAVRRALSSMLGRVEAISAVQRKLYQTVVTHFDLGTFTREFITGVFAAADRDDVELVLDLERVEMPVEQGVPLALMLNELLAGALEHEFKRPRGGRISLTLHEQDGRARLAITDNGVPITNGETHAMFGRALVESLSKQLRARAQWHTTRRGSTVEIDIPTRGER